MYIDMSRGKACGQIPQEHSWVPGYGPYKRLARAFCWRMKPIVEVLNPNFALSNLQCFAGTSPVSLAQSPFFRIKCPFFS